MKGYSPSLGTRLRWVFIVATVALIALFIYTAIAHGGQRRDNCWQAQKTKSFDSTLGSDLGKMRLRVTWCGNGNRITDVKDVDLAAKVTGSGSVSGWSVKDKDKSGDWYTWRGNDHGGRLTKAVVHFHRDPLPPIAIPDDEYLRLTLDVHADGSNNGEFDGGGAWKVR